MTDMEWVEVEGKSREDVVAKAIDLLGTSSESELEIEELKVTRKLMGMGGVTYKYRVRKNNEPDPVAQKPEKKEDLEEEEIPVEPAHQADRELEEDVITMGSPYRPWLEEGASGLIIPGRGKGFKKRLYSPDPVSAEDRASSSSTANKKPSKSFEPRVEEEVEVVEEEEFIPTEYEDADDSPIADDVRDKAVGFIAKTLEEMGVDGEAKGYKLSDRLVIDITSESSGLLIGRKGETLESLQYLVDIVINRQLEHRIRIILDADNYREKKKHKIFQLAKKAANDAIRTRKTVALPPMNPAERRYAHLCLADHPKVETKSEGVGSRRRVVVHPKGMKKSFGGGGGGGGYGGGKGKGKPRRY